MPDPTPITRDTIMRIALALSNLTPDHLSADEYTQLGVTEDVLGVAKADRRVISKRYEANKSRKIGRYTLSFTTSAILASAEWLGELLGVDMSGDTGGDTDSNVTGRPTS